MATTTTTAIFSCAVTLTPSSVSASHPHQPLPTHPTKQPNNYIETLPASLFALTALKTLVLSGNRLSSLPGDPSAWARLARLETLDVGGNAALTALPAALGRLGALRTLAAPRCSLRGLPAELGGCGALEAIDVCDNPSLDSFPKELGRLKRLKAVAADRTAVASVPPEVLRGCASLQTLSLRGCPIAAGALEATEGYAEFEARRRGKVTKIMQGGAATTGFDEGVDRELASPRPSSGMSGGGGGGGGAGGALRPASGLSGGGGGLAAAGGGGGAGGAAPSRRGTAS